MDSSTPEYGGSPRGSGTTFLHSGVEGDTIRRNRRDLIHLPDTDERGAPPELDEHTGPDEEAEPNTMSHSDNQPNNSHDQRNDSHDQPATRTPE